MKPIKIESDEIKNVICSGDTYIQIGDRKFLLLEVDQVRDPEIYNVTDLEEVKQLHAALNDDNPILSKDEINKMLGKLS